MKRTVTALIAAALSGLLANATITLDKCLEAGRENYPLIRQYDLLSATEAIELSDINKGWLPRVGVYAQGTIQNVVPSFPSTLSAMMHQAGTGMKGLGKTQYKAGIDLSQTIWDGGASKANREIARNRSAVSRASLDVELYGIRQRIESFYFAILLLESQIEQSESAVGVFDTNLSRLRSMVKNGTAMTSDADMIEAQALTLRQQIVAAESAVRAYRNMLSIFTGLDIADEELTLPEATLPGELTGNRPELSLMDSQIALNNAQRKLTDAALMPKIGLFAQTYYGYPGIDYFKAMMSRDLSFNIVAGIKISWSIDPLYTRSSSLRKIDTANSLINAKRETFLFNNRIETASYLENIRGIEAEMKDDEKIIRLRANVRNAAESQLRNGIIDATALTSKINDETQARLAASYHQIKLVQAIYNLKNTLNR